LAADFIGCELQRRRRGIFVIPNPVVVQAPSGAKSSLLYVAPLELGGLMARDSARISRLRRYDWNDGKFPAD
jgi:hypothetical protein